VFTGVFTAEMLLKLTALGWRIYFHGKWNRFDFLVIVLTYLFIIVSQVTDMDFGPQVTIIRSFRILRIFSFFKETKSLKIMFNTFVVTLPAMASIGGLLALLIYVYAVLGINQFAERMRVAPLDDNQNFESFGAAFLILIKVATGDGWAELLNTFSAENSITNQCIPDPSYADYINAGYATVGCGSFRGSVLYFYSYLLVVKLVFLNLFVAVILDGFDVVSLQESRTLNSDVLERVREAWGDFDPQASGFIKIRDFEQFMRGLGEPIGWGELVGRNEEERAKLTALLNLPIYNDFQDYQYVDVALALCRSLLIKDEVAARLKENPKADVELI
jgi:hypothetical protein